ncbi:MAG: phosphomethylpyrimidine synthase ThiC, partial [Abditibacteriota bacterium]|nr:phosphomethylpyrimidine synthase ThiC [Abditibacteriota bacterium]
MTQLESAIKGITTPEMVSVAKAEEIDVDLLRERVAKGTVVIPKNVLRNLKSPRGVGEGLSVKVNANIGTSGDFPNVEDELVKLRAALDAGADAVMDLSTGGDLPSIRRTILDNCTVPLGTVPIYDAAVTIARERGAITRITAD